MIESIEFKNFKALRDTTLPLGPCTIIVGPNGSGKSTVLQALEVMGGRRKLDFEQFVTVFSRRESNAKIAIRAKVDQRVNYAYADGIPNWRWDGPGREPMAQMTSDSTSERMSEARNLEGIRVFSLEADAIAAPVKWQKDTELARNGAGLAGVLSQLRDRSEERFEWLNMALAQWLPEFDRVRLDHDRSGNRVFQLRTSEGGYNIPAGELSQGTLLALAMLTLTCLPDLPALIALEEPDHGVHPHLLRLVQDTLHRLSYPESAGETRVPVQVIATTHNPYFLDLFRECPEEVVVANKVGADVQFGRLIDQPHVNEYLQDSHLSDVWYSGILGGVPCKS